jgi:glycosyltransferase involved in cell wall biosynthesis
LKVLHINFSKAGGAGAFARDLVAAQKAAGVDAHLVTLRDSDLRAEPLTDPLMTLQAALDQYVVKNSNFDSPISLLRNGTRLKSNVMEFHPDLIHLHWIEGVVSDEWINQVSVPIVWTLHDFRPISGACHHPLGCNQLATGCSSCPAVKPLFRTIVSKSFRDRKTSGLYEKVQFVAPSNWVAEIAMKSKAVNGRKVPIVYNATPQMQLNPEDSQWLDAQLGVNDARLIAIAFGSSASGLKGREFLEAFDKNVFDGYRVVTFGAEGLTWADTNLGVVSRERVSAIFSRAILAVIPSEAETFSLAAFEATRFGTPVCGLTGGAVQEIAETFGGFIRLDPAQIQSFLQQTDSVPARIIVRGMEDVVSEYQEVYQQAMSGSKND